MRLRLGEGVRKEVDDRLIVLYSLHYPHPLHAMVLKTSLLRNQNPKDRPNS